MKTYLLNYGSKDNPHSEKTFTSREEMLCDMWAMALCKSPEKAWYFDPADPGIVSNAHMTRKGFYNLPKRMKEKIEKLIQEDNLVTEADRITTYDEAVKYLLEQAKAALPLTAQTKLIDGFYLHDSLKNAIDEVESWIDNADTPKSSGWVAADGRP